MVTGLSRREFLLYASAHIYFIKREKNSRERIKQDHFINKRKIINITYFRGCVGTGPESHKAPREPLPKS